MIYFHSFSLFFFMPPKFVHDLEERRLTLSTAKNLGVLKQDGVPGTKLLIKSLDDWMWSFLVQGVCDLSTDSQRFGAFFASLLVCDDYTTL